MIQNFLCRVCFLAVMLSLFLGPITFGQTLAKKIQSDSKSTPILPGAYQTYEYFPLLRNKNVGVVANQTSLIGKTHLVDSLIKAGVHVVKIFGPEHGFRGNQADGKTILNSVDSATGIQIISLYGTHKKPTPEDLKQIDILIFDIQDVGVRFFTFISTLTYVMEACAEQKIPMIVLDRPNPNGFYVDGPLMKPNFTSFVGLHAIPIVYGLTIGEYALMVNGEKWLKSDQNCDLTVIKCKNYTHTSLYHLPVPPSPNLQSMDAIYLYPSLCLFEGTIVSVGRGTDKPFLQIGHPKFQSKKSILFIPKYIKGVSEDPLYKGLICCGLNLDKQADVILKFRHLELKWLIGMYKSLKHQPNFFNSGFDKLAGSDQLRKQIISGLSQQEIRNSWKPELDNFKKIRKNYLLYPDFE